MKTLLYKMAIRVKQAVVIKIANAAAGNTAKETRVVWRDIEEMSDRERGEGSKPIHDGTAPRWVRSIGAKEVQEAVDERPPAFEHLLTMIRAAVAVDPSP